MYLHEGFETHGFAIGLEIGSIDLRPEDEPVNRLTVKGH
jgi:hypothetical protein